MTSPPDGFHLPFEEVPDGPIETEMNFLLVDGVNVSAATVEVPPPFGRLPIVLFSFINSGNPELPVPTIGLVMTPERLLEFTEIIRKAVRTAVNEHRRLTQPPKDKK